MGPRIGEGEFSRLEEFVGFGAPTTPDMKPEDVTRCQVLRPSRSGLSPS